MKTVILAPWRPGPEDRARLWEFAKAWWANDHDWEIHEAPGPVTGPFNRAAAINEAAEAAGDWDVAVIIDTDVLLEAAQVRAAVDRAVETNRLTFAFTEYRALTPQMTDRVLAGFDGNWSPGTRGRPLATHQSSCLAITRDLWDRVGGFDERCEGWGQDDAIFAHCCRVLGGGCERIPGTVWHLHHAVSPHTAKSDPGHRAADHLAARYFSHQDPEGVAALIAERHQPDSFVLVVVTDGRRSCIERTLPAAWENLKGLELARTVICDDSADIEHHAWLRLKFPDAELVAGRRRGGFAKAVRRAWDVALGSGQPWVLWLEDDFVIPQPVDLGAMATVMAARPNLTQILLRRQAWFPAEIKAGGIIEQHPEAYSDETDGTNHWCEHQLGFWTGGPFLVRRNFLAEHTWPDCPRSEHRFGQQVMRGDLRSAFWGKRTDPPAVEHIGERSGTGY